MTGTLVADRNVGSAGYSHPLYPIPGDKVYVFTAYPVSARAIKYDSRFRITDLAVLALVAAPIAAAVAAGGAAGAGIGAGAGQGLSLTASGVGLQGAASEGLATLSAGSSVGLSASIADASFSSALASSFGGTAAGNLTAIKSAASKVLPTLKAVGTAITAVETAAKITQKKPAAPPPKPAVTFNFGQGVADPFSLILLAVAGAFAMVI